MKSLKKTPIRLMLTKIILKRHRAVSPILSTIIIFGLILTGVMIVFTQVVPYVEQAKSESTIAAVQSSLLELDSAILDLIDEGGNPGGSRRVTINMPEGKIEMSNKGTSPKNYYFSVSLLDGEGNLVQDNDSDVKGVILDTYPLSYLDYVYRSPRDLVPMGSFEYLKGPNPFQVRDQVFLTGIYSSTDYQDLTNLTLTHLNDRRHHITLNYRIAIYLTIVTQPQPEIKFQIFVVSLSSDFETIYDTFKQITVNCRLNQSEYTTFTPHPNTNELKLVWNSLGGSEHELWTTKVISGLVQLSLFQITIQKVIYEVTLST